MVRRVEIARSRHLLHETLDSIDSSSERSLLLGNSGTASSRQTHPLNTSTNDAVARACVAWHVLVTFAFLLGACKAAQSGFRSVHGVDQVLWKTSSICYVDPP